MGRGDRKSRKGKIWRGTHGKKHPKKSPVACLEEVKADKPKVKKAEVVKEVTLEKPKVKRKPAKK
jgi:ribosomal small subunit protein bTHX